MSTPQAQYKNYKQSTRGYEVNISAPATAADFDLVHGDGACNAHAVAEGVYRCILPKGWKLFMEKAPEVFSVPVEQTGTRENKRNPEAGPVPVYETIETYLPKVKKAAEDAGRSAELTSFVQSVFNEIGWDLSRNARTKKVSPEFIAKANELAEKVRAGQTTWEKTLAKQKQLGATTEVTFDADGNPNIEELAQSIKEAFANMI